MCGCEGTCPCAAIISCLLAEAGGIVLIPAYRLHENEDIVLSEYLQDGSLLLRFPIDEDGAE